MTTQQIAFGENPRTTPATEAASRHGGRVVRWVRTHPIIALCVWFFPLAWAIASLPLVVQHPFGVEVPQSVFNSAATLVGGLLPVLVITRLVDGPAGLAALGRRLVQRPPRASIGSYALVLLASEAGVDPVVLARQLGLRPAAPRRLGLPALLASYELLTHLAVAGSGAVNLRVWEQRWRRAYQLARHRRPQVARIAALAELTWTRPESEQVVCRRFLLIADTGGLCKTNA